MKKAIALLSLALAGCSTGHYEFDRNAMTHSRLTVVGVPYVASIVGTTTPVTNSTSLTAAHVADLPFKKVIAKHKHCDVALIRERNNGRVLPEFANAQTGDKVSIYGFSSRSNLPVSSKGTILGFRKVGKCYVGYTDAGSVQGMSGGPVMNERGELVGIFYGLNPEQGLSYFVPYQVLKSIM
ncbi:protease [Pantoea phage Kyle]|uniref:Protease n=1 Tax=Pantoea phage Kyle TaxID=2589665 RepID=A0A514A8K0_9CAUD|nr:protease [Pantoea phage Kyle]QDH49610.1 protease [Pantoea phage Kyle]